MKLYAKLISIFIVLFVWFDSQALDMPLRDYKVYFANHAPYSLFTKFGLLNPKFAMEVHNKKLYVEIPADKILAKKSLPLTEQDNQIFVGIISVDWASYVQQKAGFKKGTFSFGTKKTYEKNVQELEKISEIFAKDKPEFVEETYCYWINPDKKIYLENSDSKASMSGFGSIVFNIHTPDSLKKDKNFVQEHDYLWLPNMFLPYKDMHQFFNIIRFSEGQLKPVFEYLENFITDHSVSELKKLLNIKLETGSQYTWTPLHEAALWGYDEIFDALVSLGAQDSKIPLNHIQKFSARELLDRKQRITRFDVFKEKYLRQPILRNTVLPRLPKAIR